MPGADVYYDLTVARVPPSPSLGLAFGAKQFNARALDKYDSCDVFQNFGVIASLSFVYNINI